MAIFRRFRTSFYGFDDSFKRFKVLPRFSNNMRTIRILTRNEGQLHQSFLPSLRDHDCFIFLELTCSRIPLLMGVFDQLFSIIIVVGIQHVPKVRSIWKSTFGHFVREIFHEVGIRFHEWPDMFDSEFIV